jgi:hypothetical protein
VLQDIEIVTERADLGPEPTTYGIPLLHIKMHRTDHTQRLKNKPKTPRHLTPTTQHLSIRRSTASPPTNPRRRAHHNPHNSRPPRPRRAGKTHPATRRALPRRPHLQGRARPRQHPAVGGQTHHRARHRRRPCRSHEALAPTGRRPKRLFQLWV